MNAVALVIVVISNVAGQLLFKLAADQVKDEANPISMVVRLFGVPAMWAGLISYAITTLAWVWVLRIMPLSVAYAVVALVFVLVPLLAVWLYKEPVTWQLLVGFGLITLGIVLVQTQPR